MKMRYTYNGDPSGHGQNAQSNHYGNMMDSFSFRQKPKPAGGNGVEVINNYESTVYRVTTGIGEGSQQIPSNTVNAQLGVTEHNFTPKRRK